MKQNNLLALFDRCQRIDIEHPGMIKSNDGSIVRFVRPGGGMNFVSYSQLQPAELDAAIQAQVDFFKPLDQPFEWHVYEHDTPPELSERLQAHGFAIDEPSPIMLLDIREAPALHPVLTETVTADVRHIANRNGLETVIGVMEKVYGGDFAWMRKRMGDHLDIPGFLSIYVAYADDEPGCAGWTYFYPNGHFAGLWGGSTVPDLRNRGLYTALLATRAQEALQRGYQFLYLDASEMSRPIVKKYGFQMLTTTTAYEYEGK